jgi:hypothetical protein
MFLLDKHLRMNDRSIHAIVYYDNATKILAIMDGEVLSTGRRIIRDLIHPIFP